jgi:transcriptional regulator with XRE-family HTH domain
MSFYKSFAMLMREKREEMDLSQGDLAKRTNLTRSAISKIESGQYNVLAHNLLMIAIALHIPLQELRKLTRTAMAGDVLASTVD